MKIIKKYISLVLIVSFICTAAGIISGPVAVKADDEKPLFTMACLSDLHNQGTILTDDDADIRGSITLTIDAMKQDEEKVDAIVISGDITSNVETTEYKLYTILDKTQDKVTELTTNTFWTTGNHDYNAGGTSYNSAEYYYNYVEPYVGYVDTEDDLYIENRQGTDYVCGYHYEMNGVDIICLLDPKDLLEGGLQYDNNTYTDGTLDWLEDTLDRVHDEYRPVFVIAHFPFSDSNNISDPAKGLLADTAARMKEIFTRYDNLYYIYGHDHGGDKAYCYNDTYERVTEYDEFGQVMNPVNEADKADSYGEKRFTSMFMGSMRFYNNNYDTSSNYIGERTPKVIQAMLIYVYEDRIEFTMKNYGEVTPGDDYILEPYIVDRKIRPTPEPTAVPTPAPLPAPDGNNTAQPQNNNNTVPAPAQVKDKTAVTVPKVQKAVISRFKAGKNGKNAVIKLKKLSGAAGYQIVIGTDKKFKKKVIYNKHLKSTDIKVKKLKKSKKYYVRARGYVLVDGKKSYGPWSKVKKE